MPESIFSARMRKINYKFTKVGSGKNHGMGINTDNEVFTWGSNIYGQLGIGDSEDTNCKNLIGLKGVIDACGGENHSLFLTNDGSLYGCGKNDDYQLGLPNDQKYFVPTKVPIENVTKVRTFGNFSIVQVGNVLYSFGTCYSGGMGFDDDHVLKPTRIPFDFPEIMDFQVGSNFAVVATK